MSVSVFFRCVVKNTGIVVYQFSVLVVDLDVVLESVWPLVVAVVKYSYFVGNLAAVLLGVDRFLFQGQNLSAV